MGDHHEWSPYLYMLLLPASCLVIKRLQMDQDLRWRIFRWMAGAAGLVLLSMKLTVHVTDVFDDNGIAICWGLYAVVLFTIGLVLADKFFRRFGLIYLLIAVLHILFVDVMKLDTLGRILSFMTPGRGCSCCSASSTTSIRTRSASISDRPLLRMPLNH